jgi:hypothetical protein
MASPNNIKTIQNKEYFNKGIENYQCCFSLRANQKDINFLNVVASRMYYSAFLISMQIIHDNSLWTEEKYDQYVKEGTVDRHKPYQKNKVPHAAVGRLISEHFSTPQHNTDYSDIYSLRRTADYFPVSVSPEKYKIVWPKFIRFYEKVGSAVQ